MALKRFNTSHIIIVFTLVLILFANTLIRTSTVSSLLSRLDILPHKEIIKELYFENHNDLPKIIIPNKEQSFSFTVHNLEYNTMTYPYQVFLIDDAMNIKELVASGEMTLNQDQSKTIQQPFISSTLFDRVRLELLLVNKNQSIHFWMEGKKK
jgi:hypothetical protein